MRTLIAILLALSLTACNAFFEDDVAIDADLSGRTLHELSYETIDGEERSFGAYDGQALLIVNTASECGFTDQYEGLEALHRDYGERGLVVLAFPCNDFGGQEPGSLADIQQFCSDSYDVTFPMGAKVQVVEGDGQSPVYAYLSGTTGKLPGWNFGKYVVGRDGVPVAFFNSGVDPQDEELVAAVEAALGN
jgi:glutathione peroxidase